MAAELPYAISEPNHKPTAATTARIPRVSWFTAAVLVLLTVNLALTVRRVHDDRAAVTFVCFAYLNMALLVCALHRTRVALLGSPAHGRAKLAVWLLINTLTVGFTWKAGVALPLGPAIVLWVVAAATVGADFYVLFLHDYEKRSASLIMPDCEKDEECVSMPDCERNEGCPFVQLLNKCKKNLTAAEALTAVTSAQGA